MGGDHSVEQVFSLNDNQMYLGKVVPSADANAAFSGAIEYNSMEDIPFKSRFSVSGDTISLFLTLSPGSEEIELQYEGDVYRSFRYTSENPVYIGVFEDGYTVTTQESGEAEAQTEIYKIIYFEISNDTSPYNLNTELRNCASITLYLQSSDGTIYDLGKSLSAPLMLDEIELQAPSENDMTWFLNYFNGEYAEENNASSCSTYNNTWAGELHSLTYQIAGYEHKFLATPYIDFSWGDIGSTAERTFGMALKISESHRYRTVGASSWTVNTGDYSRCFIIDNVQLAWTAGGNTLITYVTPHLNTPVQGAGEFNFLGLAATITGVIPQTASLSTILSFADPILDLAKGSSTSFTNTQRGGLLMNTGAYKLKFPENYYIEESGYGIDSTEAERFELDVIMATHNSNLTSRHWTYAVADAYFVLSWEDITGQSGSKTYEVSEELGYYNNC